MTSNKIGVNLRVSGNSSQGGRRYMEDTHATRFIRQDGKDYEFAYFGIFDGHGGPEASRFARDNLLDEITKYGAFWSENDEDIMWAIRNGFLDTHQAMWREVDKWPKTWSGLPSTAGTTASIAIIKNCKLYIGHVGDSGIVLGLDKGPPNAVFMDAKCLTKEHKPDSPEEKSRIENCGGAVVAKSGVQRVVWSRPKVHHKGPIRRSTQIDKIPFLAVARSLGDLWSYDYFSEKFVVSPEPDVAVHKLDPQRHKCLVLASDGLWNMLKAEESVAIVSDLEMHFEDRVVNDETVPLSYWVNPAERLVTRALNKWRARMMKADNTSAIVVLIDPLGPSKLSILKKRREEAIKAKSSMEASIADGHKDDQDTCSSEKSLNTENAAACEPPSTPQQGATPLPPTPKSAPAKLSTRLLNVGRDSDKEADEHKSESRSGKSAQKLTLPHLQSDVLDDSVQLLASLKTTPSASAVPPDSGTSSKLPSLTSNGFTSIKEPNVLPLREPGNQKLGPWPCSSSPDVHPVESSDTWTTKSRVENVRTRSMSGGNLPAPGVLCQQKSQGNNDKNKAPPAGCERVLKPARLSGAGKVLRQEGENHLLRDAKGKNGKRRHQDFVVSKLEDVNKNNSNDMSHYCTKQKNKHSKGIVRKTRRTLRQAKDAAKRAMCLENSLFLGGKCLRNQNSSKRKNEDSLNGPVAKRLRRSDSKTFPL
ncbi:protein phosphatase 1D-like isoform X1 [Haliotis rubra]|uniref:protein phosphatase 1D-like isoform X1 n=2 Tax=Haliotis rubra TaxID=36100 RepID=UPI001EE5CD8F|nr:protein phosphatase 1D-like isoform X1 [Haliotis rubra]